MRYLDRYLLGEYEDVWHELVAAGEQVQHEPLFGDALAVAHETMKRVRHNLELLIPRLITLGFHFGEGMFGHLTPSELTELQKQAPISYESSSQPYEAISEIEKNVGVLPLSLRAFYEVVGSVNLIGQCPSWRNLLPKGIENITQFMNDHPTFDWKSYSLDHGLDPLFVWSPEMVLLMYDSLKMMANSVGDEMDIPFLLNVAPDHFSKYGMGGDGPYVVAIPSLAADAPLLDEWHHTTFVNYLRISFQWGGMPGLERSSSPPLDDIAFLTSGFLPF